MPATRSQPTPAALALSYVLLTIYRKNNFRAHRPDNYREPITRSPNTDHRCTQLNPL